MRKNDSLFDHYCTFINANGIGYVYTSTELNANVGIHEQPTRWKSWNNNRYYRTRTYQSMLARCGFLKKLKRGSWEIMRTIPDWFTLAHLHTLMGYENANSNLSKEVILDRLNTTTILNAVPPSSKASNRLEKLSRSLESAYNATYNAFYGSHPYGVTQTDPLYYASGAYAQETEQKTLPTTDTPTAPPIATITRVEVSPEEKEKQSEQWKYRQQLQENLMLNAGYINSALVILDQADFLDPVQHARVVNIMAQLKDLQRTIDERIEYKIGKQIL